MALLATFGEFPLGGWELILLLTLGYVPIFTLTPRFFVSIRELDARNIEGRCGEGVGSPSSDSDVGRTALEFADNEGDGEPEGEEVGTSGEV